jgi:thiol-disulfide isomerase/thioredoxin
MPSILFRVAVVASLLSPVALSAQAGGDAGGDTGAFAESANSARHEPVHLALKTMTGDSVRIGVGEPTTLVAVFATWCRPCQDEVPALNMLQRDFGRRVRVVALNVEDGSDQHVQGWLKEYGARYPVVRNRNGAVESLGVAGIPAIFLVNSAGQVEWQQVGAMLSSLPALRARLRRLPEIR